MFSYLSAIPNYTILALSIWSHVDRLAAMKDIEPPKDKICSCFKFIKAFCNFDGTGCPGDVPWKARCKVFRLHLKRFRSMGTDLKDAFAESEMKASVRTGKWLRRNNFAIDE
jgi:hypothetical protein